MIKLITARSDKDNVLLETWVKFAVWANLKQFVIMAVPDKVCMAVLAC